MDEVSAGGSNSDISVKQLFSDSWHISLHTILRYIVICLISLFIGGVAGVLVWILGGSALVSMIGWDKLSQAFSGKESQIWFDILTNQKIQVTAGIVFLTYVLLAFIIQSLVAIATIMAIDTAGQPFSFGIVIQKAKRVLLPYMLLQILMGFLYIGSVFFFFLPFLLVVFFLLFANYELVLNNQSAFNALRRSVYLVTKNFGQVFIAVLIFLGLEAGFQALPGLIGQVFGKEAFAGTFFLFLIFYFVLSFIFNWFMAVFMITLYKRVSHVTDKTGRGHVWWMWIVSLIGWLILLGIILLSYKLVGAVIEKASQVTPAMETEQLTYVSSGCGLEIGLPATNDNYLEKERGWVFRELPGDRSAFQILSQKALPADNVEAVFVEYRDPNEDVNDENGNFKQFPGLDIRCADNKRGLNLETFAGLLATSQEMSMEIEKENSFTSDNGVPLEFFVINFKGKNGEELKDPGYIAVSEDGDKLIYIDFFGAAKDDPIKDQISKDVNTILKNLKYGPTYIIPLNKKTTSKIQPAYSPAPTIKPGEMGSQEWLDNFNKQFEENQKRTQEVQTKMCADNPSLCN